MTDRSSPIPFLTVAMADILLAQDQNDEAEQVITALEQQNADDPRITSLRHRLDQRRRMGELSEEPVENIGTDRISLSFTNDQLRMEWELTPGGLDIAKRRVRYSGRVIARLFTAAPGPRGVRTLLRDYPLQHHAATLHIAGVLPDAVCTASIGFLGHNGEFVSMAHALPLSVRK